jgi:TldD protein
MSESTARRNDDALSLFRDRFGLDDAKLASALDTALERHVDYADLFFEYSTHDSVALEEGIVKTGGRHVEQGVGVRAQIGERQGYAHSDDITVESVQLAATTARAISQEAGAGGTAAVSAAGAGNRDLYPVATPPTEVPVDRKVGLLNEIDVYARSLDPRVKQVIASALSQYRHVFVVGSDGTFRTDVRPLVRLNVQVVTANANGVRREDGYQGSGGRFELDRLLDPKEWKPLVEEAVRIAVLNLESVPCPAGTMDVVLGPGWPGILLHEAIGHGLEGDFNRKRTSAFSDKLGQRVAAPGVTVVDDGTLPGRRLQDRLNAKLMDMGPTGNGRRESYAHRPLPRMTNTFMLAGEEDPQEILASVKSGLYAVSFGGGQVDITSGKFVFSASEAYRIEDGKIGAPVKGATLIGNGDVLRRVARIGADLELDRGIGTCGKDGQGVPVGVGLPTLRVDGLTVGGTEG